jgi:hypothetical protein
MRISTIVLSALLSLPALVAGCMNDHRAADRLPPPVPATTPASMTVPEGSSIPAPGRATAVPPEAGKSGASSGAGLPPDPDKDKPRGNTPPGTDRSGGGPADGAIRDPAGAVTKQPEPKAPIN